MSPPLPRHSLQGKLADGTEFDSSHNRGEPIEFALGVGQVRRGKGRGGGGRSVEGRATGVDHLVERALPRLCSPYTAGRWLSADREGSQVGQLGGMPPTPAPPSLRLVRMWRRQPARLPGTGCSHAAASKPGA